MGNRVKEEDDATNCKAPKIKTVNQFMSDIQTLDHVFIYFFRDPESVDGHIRPVADLSFNPDGEQ